MSINWNELIKSAEGDLAKALTTKVVAGILSAVPALGWAAGPLGFVIGLLIGWLVKLGDWGAYFFADSKLNNANGKDYQAAGEELANLPPTATKEERDAKKKAKSDAFDRFMGAG